MRLFKDKSNHSLLIGITLLALTACGSDDDDDKDTSPPVITILGENPTSVLLNEVYTDAGASAVDDKDGSVSVSSTGTVDVAVAGVYTITYSAADSAGNTATAPRNVNVVLPLDTTPPVITLIGISPLTIALGSTYVDQGATAEDDVDQTVEVITTGNVDTAVLGSYILTYTSTDTSGNEATAIRTVNVILPSQGVLLDSPVASIGYKTDSSEGLTDDKGQFPYLPGESVIFFIGDLTFPAVTATGVVTPENIAAGDNTTQTNILQILQTLDEDANPDNGISIIEGAVTAFTDSILDITSADFDTNVVNDLAIIGGGLSLVSEDDANDHFDNTLKSQLLGSWVFSEGESMRNILTFIDDSHYTIFHEHGDTNNECGDSEGCQSAGSGEYGSYTWDIETKAFTSAVISESDGSGGLGGLSAIASIEGNTLEFLINDENSNDPSSVIFSKITNSNNSLVGSWIVGSGNVNNINILTFLSDSEYVIYHNANGEADPGEEAQAVSGEFGRYSLEDTNFIILSTTVDSDGEGGLYDSGDTSPGLESLVLEPWGDLVLTDSIDGPANIARIGSYAVALQDYDASRSLGTITTRRELFGFPTSIINKTWQMAFDLLGDDKDITLEFTLSSGGAGVMKEISEADSFAINWQWNSVGDIVVTFNDGEKDFVFTLINLAAQSSTGMPILVSRRSSDTPPENTLLETKLVEKVE
jgi:hypothetical protein